MLRLKLPSGRIAEIGFAHKRVPLYRLTIHGQTFLSPTPVVPVFAKKPKKSKDTAVLADPPYAKPVIHQAPPAGMIPVCEAASTEVKISITGHGVHGLLQLAGETKLHCGDQFCYQTGRYHALQNLLENETEFCKTTGTARPPRVKKTQRDKVPEELRKQIDSLDALRPLPAEDKLALLQVFASSKFSDRALKYDQEGRTIKVGEKQVKLTGLRDHTPAKKEPTIVGFAETTSDPATNGHAGPAKPKLVEPPASALEAQDAVTPVVV